MKASFCALCTSTVGPFRARAIGAKDSIVAVCSSCDGEHPRSGRYSFGASRGDTGGEVQGCYRHRTGIK